MESQGANPVTTYETILGQILQDARKAHGLSQAEMAALVGVSQPYWSKIEQGEANPSTGLLRRASEEFGLPYSELIGRVDRVCEEATAVGVNVISREDVQGQGVHQWLPLLGVAAVAALIGYVLGRGGKG